MTAKQPPHRHVATRVRVVVQRAGVPYEIEREICRDCRRILAEKPLRRTAA